MSNVTTKCVYCRTCTARPDHETCSKACQAALECTDPDCPCNATKCVVDGKPINKGDIICSRLCAEEADNSPQWNDIYHKTMYPHG